MHCYLVNISLLHSNRIRAVKAEVFSKGTDWLIGTDVAACSTLETVNNLMRQTAA